MLTEDLLTRLAETRLDSLGTEHRSALKIGVLDLLGCLVAGSGEPAALAVAGEVGDMSDADPSRAALYLGTAAHALDLDDISPLMMHPSAPVLSALFAVAEKAGASGPALLDAYLAGLEFEVRLCTLLNPEHYVAGWHSTPTIGVLGATAAVARLTGLPDTQTVSAIAIAASSSGGVRANFGSMVKPLHVGLAASHAITAVDLARAGIVGRAEALDAPHGFLQAFGAEFPVPDDRRRRASAGGMLFPEIGLVHKRYACCGAIHSSIDALRELMTENDIDVGQIRAIECARNALAPTIVTYSDPRTPSEAMFSQEYSLAVAAFDGTVGFDQVRAERLQDAAVRNLMHRVTMRVDPGLPVDLTTFGAIVGIETDRGHFEKRVDVPRGYPERPFSAAEMAEKFVELASPILGGPTTERTIDIVGRLDDVDDLGELFTLLHPATRPTRDR